MSKPYKAIISVQVNLYEFSPTGELGLNIDPAKFKELGIQNILLRVGPDTAEGCAEKVKEIVQNIKKLGTLQ